MVKFKRAGTLVAAATSLWLFSILLRTVGYRRAKALIRSDGPPPPLAMSAKVGEAIVQAANWVPGTTCLVQACAAQFMLALRGHSSTLRVGVRSGYDGQLDAHAWLIAGSVAIVGDELGRSGEFQPIADFH